MEVIKNKKIIEKNLSLEIEENLENSENIILTNKVYPIIESALKKFISKIKDSDEIEKHIEKIKRQKIIDQNEIEKLEKEKMKKELGDDYISSESDENFSDKDSEINSEKKFFEKKNEDFKIESNLNFGVLNANGENSVIFEDVRNEVSEKFTGSSLKFDSLCDRREFNPLKLFVTFLEDEIKS